MPPSSDYDDLAFLQENANCMRAAGLNFLHLDQTINLRNYVRIANDIATQVAHRNSERDSKAPLAIQHGGTRFLDWGCGFGQMSWLLRRRAMEVTSFDIGPDDATLPDMPLCQDLRVIRTMHPTRLPFPENHFAVVLSCGVLEHVDECSGELGNERKSLAEIARVLQPAGLLLIYQLPQRAAWQEAVVRRFKLGYAHPRRYSGSEIVAMLDQAGFEVIRLRRANLVPKNLTGLPAGLRRLYSHFSGPLNVLDRTVCRIPLLNRMAGVLEISAVCKKKRPDLT